MFKINIAGLYLALCICIFFAILTACRASGSESSQDSPHIVFVTGDEEYRSEETMPMLARILKNRYGFRVTICYALTDGIIDPNRLDNIEGLDALEDADMMVMAVRFRRLPDDQLQYILDFAESGKPMIGFRTATHPFSYGENQPNYHMDFDWPQEVFGLPWISHHGSDSSTEVSFVEGHEKHPVLRGVNPFHARSWLYHSTSLKEEVYPLLTGRAVEGAEAGGEHFGDLHTVAWTYNREGVEGTGRVFFTTLGHPMDFFSESMRRLSLNGFFWALGMEDQIPAEGLDVDFIGTYDPNSAGFGHKYKPGRRPENIPLRIE